MSFIERIVAAVAVVSVLSPAAGLRAQQFGGDGKAAVSAPRDGVLLLKNGHLLAGRITWSGDHYFVDRGGLQVGVRADEVLGTAANLDDAYRQQRDKLAHDDLDGHQKLAQWCLRHELLGCAADELALCMGLHPRNPRTDSLVRQLQSAVRIAESSEQNTDDASGGAPNADPATAASGAANHGGAADTKPASAFEEISDRAAETFVTRIQPLLLNQCAGGGCHGGGGTAKLQFQRFDPQRTPSRVYTERNLAAALKFVDRDRPDASLLLTTPSQPHGAAKAPVFEGRTLGHRDELAAWVRMVAGKANRPPWKERAGQRASTGGSDAMRPQRPSGRANGEERLPATSGMSPAPDTSPNAASADVAGNPHDPDIFNRRYFPNGRPEHHAESRPLTPDPRPLTTKPSLAEDDIPSLQSIEEGDVARQQAR